MGKLTIRKYKILKLIDSMCTSELGVAPTQKLIDVLTEKYKVKQGAVRKTIWQLNKWGYLENPIRGGWRLGPKGREAVENVEKSMEFTSTGEDRCPRCGGRTARNLFTSGTYTVVHHRCLSCGHEWIDPIKPSGGMVDES
jgi:hypothetical protein